LAVALRHGEVSRYAAVHDPIDGLGELMAVLRPYPFGALVRRAFRELDEKRALFDLPVAKRLLGDPELGLSGGRR
jgi:hypothetical protein